MFSRVSNATPAKVVARGIRRVAAADILMKNATTRSERLSDFKSKAHRFLADGAIGDGSYSHVGLACLAEVVAIVMGVQVLAHDGRPDLIVSFIAVVVGLHFLPLARWIPMPKYYVSALALVIAACMESSFQRNVAFHLLQAPPRQYWG